MMCRSSRGNRVRMSVSSAIATFLAARKQPRSSIERLMSTSSTVASGSSARSGGPRSRRLEADRRRSRPAPGRRRVLLAAQRVGQGARRSRWNGSPNSYGLVVSSRSPPRPARSMPVAAEGVAPEAREQLVEHPLADPPGAPRRQLQPLAVARQVARPPRAAGPDPRARRGRAARPRRAGRAPRRGRSRRGRPGDSTSASCVLEPVERRSRASWARAPSSPSGSSPLNGTRSPSPPGSSWSSVEASWARSQRSRSSRRSASIIDWSSARCSGLIERISDCIAAIRWASCSMMSSRSRAREEAAVPGQELRWRPGSPPSEALAEQLVEVADHLAVRREVLGRHARIASDMPCQYWSSTCARSRSTSASNRSRASAPGSRSPAGRGSARPRSGGSPSSWSSRRAARSRSIVEASASRALAVGPASRRASTPRRADARRPRAPRRRSRSSSRRMSPSDVAELVALEQLLARRRSAAPAGRCSPAMSPRVGSPVRQPRSISRRRASARSPSAMTSSASASRISSASRSGDGLAAVPAGVAGLARGLERSRRRSRASRRSRVPRRIGRAAAPSGPRSARIRRVAGHRW